MKKCVNLINVDELLMESEIIKIIDKKMIFFILWQNKIIYVNSFFETSLGYNKEELINRKTDDVLDEDFKEIIKENKNGGKYYNIKAYKKNGEEIWIDACTKELKVNHKEITLVLACEVTKYVDTKEALKKLRDQLEIEIEKRTEELNKANQELTLINSYMNSILMNTSEGVAVIDELGNFKNLNGNPERDWYDHIKDIEKSLKKILIEEKKHDIYKMLKEKKSFYGSELTVPTGKGNLQFFISGDPIEDKEGSLNKGVIVFRPIKQVHDLINRFSGAQARFNFSDIITKNKKMIETVELAFRASMGDSNVLVQGESGTGKELFAQAIHNYSNRCRGPFVAVNCGAIPRDLIGSELFGYVEGAFTGARKGGKPGKFQLASGGTIFLDEIGDMPFEQQVSLLRVIQEKKVTRIGGEEEIPIDVRIICATNKNLFEAMQNGSFRNDLYYRLNVISVKIPSLRERREDIPLLFEYFIKQTTKNGEKLLENMDPMVMKYLTKYNWYGNVRELQNVVERIVHMVHDEHVTINHLPENILQYYCTIMDDSVSKLENEVTIKDIVKRERKMQEEQECNEILRLFKEYKGNLSKVARILGISRSTLYRKLNKYKIDKDI
jgi:PAS domain S-box-containing protein